MADLTFKTPFSKFQLSMLREAERKENRKLIDEFQEGQLYELTERGMARIKAGAV
jgi:hypothetical protein